MLSLDSRTKAHSCPSSAAAAATICIILLCMVQLSAEFKLDGLKILKKGLPDTHMLQRQQQHAQSEASTTMLPLTTVAIAEQAAVIELTIRQQQQHQDYLRKSPNTLPPVGTAVPVEGAPGHVQVPYAGPTEQVRHMQQEQQQQQQEQRQQQQLHSGSRSSRRRRLAQAQGTGQACADGQGCCGSGPAPRIGAKDSTTSKFVTTVLKRPPRFTRQTRTPGQPAATGSGVNDTVTDSSGNVTFAQTDDDVDMQLNNSTSDNSTMLDDSTSSFDDITATDDTSSNSMGNVTTTSGSSSNSSSGDGIVTPAAVCPNDAEFTSTVASRTTCRFFANFWERGSQVTYMCSAWFVSPTHLVTAGHCISDGDATYGLDKSDPGYVCCNFMYDAKQDRMVCNPSWQWNVTKWVTTAGFYRHASSHNDGAVIAVVQADPTSTVVPVPQNLASYFTNNGKWRPATVPVQQIYLDGYPGADPTEYGCSYLNTTTRYHTLQSRARPVDGSGTEGAVIYYEVSGCQGMSGGRVLRNSEKGQAFGIQTAGDPWCNVNKRGMTEVTQIARNSNTNCGVCVSCLVAALNRDSSSKPRAAR